MHGEPPKALPITFEKTKYHLIEQCMHNLIRDREEVLAAHKLAMRRIADRQKIPLFHSRKVTKSGWTQGI